MRVLLLNQVFYPDVAATAQHGHDLARHLVKHGHEVMAIASRSIYGEKGAALPAHEVVDGIEIHRVGRSLFGKSSIVARAMDFALFYFFAAIKAFSLPRPDVVVCFTTPPFIALLGWLMRAARGSAFVYWVMDLYPDVPVASGVMREGSLATRFFERLNRFCLRKADRVVVLGRCMMQRVRDKGIDGGHVVHIGVWSDGEEVHPLPRQSNPYRAEWKLGDDVVVMYSGNFGLAHDVQTMLGAAKELEGRGIRFAFVGGGKRKGEVEQFVKEHSLTCRCEPYQPRERLDASLSLADVHIVSIKEGFEGLVVPCKLFGIMAAARPTVFVGHPDSEIGRVLIESQSGVIVRQGDIAGLVQAIGALAADRAGRELMGANARAALQSFFDRDKACEQWRLLLESVAEASPEKAQRRTPAADSR